MWWRHRRSDQDFSHEIQAHIALEMDRLVAEGVSPEEARAKALRSFGNMLRAQENFYESRRIMWLDDLQRDVRHALRPLIRNPGFTVVVVLTAMVPLSPSKYPDPRRQATFFEEVINRIATLPGVEAASAASSVPLVSNDAGGFEVEGYLRRPTSLSFRPNDLQSPPTISGSLEFRC